MGGDQHRGGPIGPEEPRQSGQPEEHDRSEEEHALLGVQEQSPEAGEDRRREPLRDLGPGVSEVRDIAEPREVVGHLNRARDEER